MIYTRAGLPFFRDWFVGLDSFGNFLLPGHFFHRFLLESLILAQDERWRRA